MFAHPTVSFMGIYCWCTVALLWHRAKTLTVWRFLFRFFQCTDKLRNSYSKGGENRWSNPKLFKRRQSIVCFLHSSPLWLGVSSTLSQILCVCSKFDVAPYRCLPPSVPLQTSLHFTIVTACVSRNTHAAGCYRVVSNMGFEHATFMNDQRIHTLPPKKIIHQ